jgi:serine/threonine protein kinase
MTDLIGGERYELERRIGHGGMATVFSAHDLKLDRPVAIKLLADNYAADQEVRKRFSREARLAAKLDHPNVVQVFDVGEEGERPYIVMERVEGGTLADRLGRRRRSLRRDEGLRLLDQLCEGLGHAHGRKLVHRDIKPQNLLLRESDGYLKIADFGIARAVEETTRLTRPGRVIGTDRYMAPEQLADGAITTATDVYACGVVADEMLPESRSPELREIIERCLREDPKQRFSDATALGEALAAIHGDGAGVARRLKSQSQPPTRRLTPATIVRRRSVAPHAGRRRVGPRLAAALALIAAVGVGVAIAIGSGGSDEPTKAKRGTSAAPTVSVPQSGDPADDARTLADFLRAQGRVPGQTAGR